MLDGLRGYLQLASGLTEVTRERAMATARALVNQGSSTVESALPEQLRGQVSGVADELIATSRANRDLLLMVVRGEVERSVARLGLVSAVDMDAALRRARGLEARVAELEAELQRSQPVTASRTTTATRAKKPTARKTRAKKTVAKKTTAKKTVAKKTTAKKTVAKKTVAKKTAVRAATGARSSSANALRETFAPKSTSASGSSR